VEVTTSDAGENRLSIPEWIEAWKRLSSLIEQYTPHMADVWAKHYARIFYDTTFSSLFEVWLNYDIQVRRRSLEEDLDLDMFQSNIFECVKNSINMDTRDRRDYARAPRSPADRRSMSPPATRISRQAPYWGTRRDSTGYTLSARDSGHPRPENRAGPRRRNKCLRCGATGHQPKSCTAETRANGKPIVTTRSQDGYIQLDGRAFCYPYNGSKGCSERECEFGPHVCSLCGKTGHDAQSCRD
jgi:hypothetical protein